MQITGKIGIRVAVLLLIGVLAQILYKNTLWDTDLWERGQMLAELEGMDDSCQVIYFGESSNFSYHPLRDSLKDRISDFLSYHFNGLTFGTINHAAYHAGLYRSLIARIEKGSAVECVVVTMNLRTFGQAVTHSPLETAMQQEKVLFSGYPELLRRTFLTLNFFDNKTELDRDYIKWKEWTYDTLQSTDPQIIFKHPTIRSWCAVEKFPDSNGVEDMEKRSLADHYIKAYAFQIGEDNPRVRDCDAIMRICSDLNVQVVFNILAENVEYADSLVGPELVWLMRQNRDYLVERYSKLGAVMVDNLEAVDGYHFTDQNWTTEHYDAEGRQRIAFNVAKAMEKIFSDEIQADLKGR